jgi:hypothetical protein
MRRKSHVRFGGRARETDQEQSRHRAHARPIIPLVLGSNSEPLDVGRSERLITRPMRRALNTRDKGCVVCGAPPIHCDAHHLQSWIDGGATAVWNLVLLCRRHHIDLHAGHWTIQIIDGVVHVTRPTWADPSPPRARRPHRRTPSVAPGGTSARTPYTEDRESESRLAGPPPDGVATSPQDAVDVPPSPGDALASPVESARLDPWSEPATPEQPTSARSARSRWRADDGMLKDAARFAVWGDTPTDARPETSSPLGRRVPSRQTAHLDPWGDTRPAEHSSPAKR